MNLPKPLNNNVLVEIIDPYHGVARNGTGESHKEGRIIDFAIAKYHITASAAICFGDDFIESKSQELAGYSKNGSLVLWEEFANEGQELKKNGKTYALIPWWRLIGVSTAEGNSNG
jgi:hypothetical protein